MDNIRKASSICVSNIRKWATNPRIYILSILLIMLMLNYVYPISGLTKKLNYRVTPWLFPFISNYFITQCMMMLGIVFLFCDAPFIDEWQPYLLVRSGRTTWALGQVLYIMLSTAIYFIFIVILSILILFPNIFLNDSWGKILSTLAQTNIGQFYGIYLPIDYKIQVMYSPLQAFGLSILLDWCAGTMLGLIIFIFNVSFNRAIGAIIASAIVFLDITISNSLPYYMNHFSPVSMARLTILDPSGLSPRPTNLYAYIFFLVSIVILSVAAVLSVRKRDIQVLPPV